MYKRLAPLIFGAPQHKPCPAIVKISFVEDSKVYSQLSAFSPPSVFDIQDRMKSFGWVLPAFTCPPPANNVHFIRLVVKENTVRETVLVLFKVRVWVRACATACK